MRQCVRDECAVVKRKATLRRQPQKLSFVDLRSRKVKQYLPDLGPVHVEIDASSFNLMTPDVDRASGRLE
jgi:hypothetical protein